MKYHLHQLEIQWTKATADKSYSRQKLQQTGSTADRGDGRQKLQQTKNKLQRTRATADKNYSTPCLHQTMATSAIAHSLQSQGQPFSFEQQIRTCLGLKSRRRKARRSAGSQTAKFSKSPRAERKFFFGLNFF